MIARATLNGTARCGARGGFTLLEVLSATMMFSVIVGALYSAFYGALRLRERAFATFEKELPRDYVAGTIERDLASALPPTGILAGAFIGTMLEEGDRRVDELDFYCASGMITRTAPWSDILHVQYYLEEPELTDTSEAALDLESRDLVRAVTRNLLPETEEEPELQRLLGGVRSFELAYYDGTDWQDAWDSSSDNLLPVAIRVRIEFIVPLAPGQTRPTAAEEAAPPVVELVVPIVAKSATATTEQTDQTAAQ